MRMSWKKRNVSTGGDKIMIERKKGRFFKQS